MLIRGSVLVVLVRVRVVVLALPPWVVDEEGVCCVCVCVLCVCVCCVVCAVCVCYMPCGACVCVCVVCVLWCHWCDRKLIQVQDIPFLRPHAFLPILL